MKSYRWQTHCRAGYTKRQSPLEHEVGRHTLEKEQSREVVRQYVTERLEPMIEAQIGQ